MIIRGLPAHNGGHKAASALPPRFVRYPSSHKCSGNVTTRIGTKDGSRHIGCVHRERRGSIQNQAPRDHHRRSVCDPEDGYRMPHARGDSTSSCGALHHQSVSMRFGGPSVRAFVVFPVPENESGKYSHAHERGVVRMHEGNHTQSGVRMACAGEGVLQGSDSIAQGSSGC
jgi:hypothetical protein